MLKQYHVTSYGTPEKPKGLTNSNFLNGYEQIWVSCWVCVPLPSLAAMIAVEAFLHYTCGVGYSSATSRSDFGMADVMVSSYLLFAFRRDGAMRATRRRRCPQHGPQ